MKQWITDRHALALALTATLAAGCAPMPAGGAGNAPLTTGHPEYRASQGPTGLAVDVDFSFTNATGRTLYVPVCRQPHPPSLEKLERGEWVPAYSPAVLMCWEPPVEIAPGAAFADTLRVRAGLPGSDVHPQLEVDEVGGTYRLAWSVLHSNQPGSAGERLTSRPFAIERAPPERE